MRNRAFDTYSNKGRVKAYAHEAHKRAGQMRYMGEYYWSRTTFDLSVLRSKKYNRVAALRRLPKTYLNIQETKKLNEQMAQIDAVLAARKDQEEMGL
jgi:hypothetical protein